MNIYTSSGRPRPSHKIQRALALLWTVVPTIIVFILFVPAIQAQTFPGGFVESGDNVGVRPRLSRSQIQSWLPARGKFTFPPPYNTEALRLTNADDCGGTDCVNYVGYSYWANMNNHVDSDTLLVFLGLGPAHGGPTLFSVHKPTDTVTKLGPLFEAASPFSRATGEGWYFSGTQFTKLYVNDGSRLLRYDVLARTFETVLDIATQPGLYGANRYIWQTHSSADDRVHIGTVRDSANSAMLGCFVYEENLKKYTYYPGVYQLDECNLDRSGRWMIMLDNVDRLFEQDNRIIDLKTGDETVILDQDGALGHLDMGDGYAVGADNWNPLPNATILIKFPVTRTTAPVGPVVHYNANWSTAAANHVTHQNRRAPESQYACGSNVDGVPGRENEIVCFRLDSSMDVLVVAPVMTDVNAAGGGDFYSQMPKGNLDVTGRYFIWTANMGGDRLDAFIVKVPAQRLVGSVPNPDTIPPTVSITAPIARVIIAGTVTVSAGASDNVGVAGVQFQLDGANLGPEDTTAPYSTSWNTTIAANGSHLLTAVARDAAGNKTTSSVVSVTVINGDTTAPIVSIATTASRTTVSGTIAVSATAADNVGVAGVQFKLDGANLGIEDTTAPYSTSWNTTTAANGSHLLTAVARDAAGNMSSAAATVTVFNANNGTVPGLIGYWKFDEGSGTTTSDASGNGNTATLINGPSWVPSGINGTLSFDGVNDYVNVPHTPTQDAYPLTVAVWIKTNATGLHGIANKYFPGSLNGYQVFTNAGNLCAWYFKDASNYIWDGSGCTLQTPGYNDNQWHHVVFVVTASGGRLYVDGTRKTTQVWTGTPGASSTTQNINLGQYPGTATPFFPGLLDDVRIYNRALSAAEVSALFSAATPGTVEKVNWANPVNVTVTGNTLQKTNGCDGCADAGALSQQKISSGNGYLEFTATETGTFRFAGLSNGNSGTRGDGIAFAIRLQSGIAEIRERGVYRTDTPFISGDLFRVSVEAGVVKYYKNKVLLYTSTTPPLYPLIANAALYTLNGTIVNAMISGAFSP